MKPINPYEKLAQAIIMQAVKDYRGALKVLRICPKDYIANMRKRDCEKFFCSAWFTALTEADGEDIMNRLRKEEAA